MKHVLLLVLLSTSSRCIGQLLWYDDFSDPTTWVVGHDGNVQLDWQIGTVVPCGSSPMAPIASTTANNGYALLDSDCFQNFSGERERAHITTAIPMDLSAASQAILRFETQYWQWTDQQVFVVVSTDGTFPELDLGMDISNMPNVFPVLTDVPMNAQTANPELVTVDITPAIGGSPTSVWLRFYWIGEYGYAWFIDDVRLFAGLTADLSLDAVHISNSPFIIYAGCIPQAQLGDGPFIGGTFTNLGPDPELDILLSAQVVGPTPFLHEQYMGALQPTETGTLLQSTSTSLLFVGPYEATFSVTSSLSPVDVDPGNNEQVRRFRVTESTYALDGIGSISNIAPMVGELGTGSFPNCEDGMTLFSYMQVNSATDITAMEALLAPGSEAGGHAVFSIHDTAEVFEAAPASPLYNSEEILITPTDIEAGFIQAPFPPGSGLLPGGYFLGVTLFSNAGAYPVAVKDDQTYTQPPHASVFYHPSDMTVYADGNALALRAELTPSVPCYAEFIATQGTDGNGEPVPYVVNIVNTSVSNAAITDWLWDFGDGSSSTDEFPEHQYTNNGPYSLCLTISDAEGCTDQYCDSIAIDESGLFTRSEGFILRVVPEAPDHVEEKSPENPLRAWPNPVSDVLTVDMPSLAVANGATIKDALGSEIPVQGLASSRIDVSLLAPGLYTLQLGGHTTRFVKQ